MSARTVTAADREALIADGQFDSDWYLAEYPDVKLLGMDPAEHYVRFGAVLGRKPAPPATTRGAPARPPAHEAALAVGHGRTGASATPFPHLGPGYAFCDDIYLSTYPDLATTDGKLLDHFITLGFAEGRSGTYFDGEWYLDKNRDVAQSGMGAYDHYRQAGRDEGRRARFLTISVQDRAGQTYDEWIKAYDATAADDDRLIAETIPHFALKPLISVVMPVYNPPIGFFIQAIESVLTQSYANLELCIADDASPDPLVRKVLEAYEAKDPRVKVLYRQENGHISEATNSALAFAAGDYVALLDHDDLLARHALFWIVAAINDNPDADLIYSDEDKIDEAGRRFEPYFKSDFNYELFLAHNMISHLGIYRRSVLEEIGGFRKGFEGSQDYDVALRVIESISVENIVHIPRILYHWRAIAGSTALAPTEKNYAKDAGKKAVEEHLARRKCAAKVVPAPEIPSNYRVRYDLADPEAVVSIIIPTRDKCDLLEMCLSSIFDRSTHQFFEIIVIDNGSVEAETFEYFEQLTDPRVKIIRDDRPFNYSRINNLASSHATGQYICLMNNDIEIITADWMEEMLSFAQRPDVGCVGARLWYPDDTLQHGGIFVGLGGVAGHSHKHLRKGDAGYAGRAVLHQALSAVTAACLMVKASIYRQVGGLDEDLAVAFNDVDFCLRVREAGYRNVWTPYAEMYHHESASRGLDTTPEKKARFNREIDFIQRRWGPTLQTDPYYSPNLTTNQEDFSLALHSRIEKVADVRSRFLAHAGVRHAC